MLFSCRAPPGWWWSVRAESLQHLSQFCDEFLVHGVDVEGMRQGILVRLKRLLIRCPRRRSWPRWLTMVTCASCLPARSW